MVRGGVTGGVVFRGDSASLSSAPRWGEEGAAGASASEEVAGASASVVSVAAGTASKYLRKTSVLEILERMVLSMAFEDHAS